MGYRAQRVVPCFSERRTDGGVRLAVPCSGAVFGCLAWSLYSCLSFHEPGACCLWIEMAPSPRHQMELRSIVHFSFFQPLTDEQRYVSRVGPALLAVCSSLSLSPHTVRVSHHAAGMPRDSHTLRFPFQAARIQIARQAESVGKLRPLHMTSSHCLPHMPSRQQQKAAVLCASTLAKHAAPRTVLGERAARWPSQT